MIHIDNLKEKELLIAYYFCGKSRKQLSPYEVFDMWSNWFRYDFRVNNKPVFCIENDKLEYRKDIEKRDEKILKQYNNAFQGIYYRIKRSLEIEEHNQAFFRNALDEERNREYGRVLHTVKLFNLNVYVRMNFTYKKLADFTLMDYKNRTHTLKSGDCDRMIAYLQNLKNKRVKHNKQ